MSSLKDTNPLTPEQNWDWSTLHPTYEATLRATISPVYATVPGTESHERAVFFGEIDRLRAEVAELAQQRGDLAARVVELQRRIEHTNYWYGTRHRTLFDWAHRELDERLRHQYFSIVANGTPSPQDPPTYAQQFNQLQHRAKAAEAALLKARQLVSVSSIDVETLISACVPGGSVCDPQTVADAIRRYCDAWPNVASESQPSEQTR